jgi:hypothetical protein
MTRGKQAERGRFDRWAPVTSATGARASTPIHSRKLSRRSHCDPTSISATSAAARARPSAWPRRLLLVPSVSTSPLA